MSCLDGLVITGFSSVVMMIVITLGVFVHLFTLYHAKDFDYNIDRYLLSCRTTDFICFKRQYKSLRDFIFLGEPQIAIQYKPYVFQYGNSGTCIKITGMEESELVAMSIDSNHKEYSIVLEMPVKIQQIHENSNTTCATPDKEFINITKHEGELRRFTGNATIQVTYPYTLRVNRGLVFMQMEEENLDVLLDIPDLSYYDKGNPLEAKLYEWSEWAFEAVHHINLASQSIAPFTNNLNFLLERIPLERFILLYPDEEYTNLQVLFGRKTSE